MAVHPSDNPDVLQRALERERAARKETEALLESKSRELFEANERLAARAHKADVALTESLQTLRVALRAASLGVWSWFVGSEEIELDDGLANLLAYGDTGLSLRLDAWLADLGPQAAPSFRDALDRCAAGADAEFVLEHQFGAGRVLRTRGAVVSRDEKSVAARLVGVVQDVTEQKKAVREAGDRAAARARTTRLFSLDEMASTLAHELNQPLGSIANYSDVIQRRLAAVAITDDAIIEAAGRIADLSRRSGDIVRGIRSLLRPATGPATQVLLATVLDHAIEAVDLPHVAPHISLDVCQTTESLLVSCDPVLVEQVLVNLVRNAVEAIGDTDEPEGTIRIRAQRDGSMIRVECEDSGPGLAPDQAPDDIFHAFHTTKENGIGLGLSICRSIVQASGGDIGCEPLDRGCRFWFTMPAAEAVS
ncbi:MAG: ATP-binding protein [Planctomycetota bacterium]